MLADGQWLLPDSAHDSWNRDPPRPLSAAAERGALTPGLPLYAYALRLHRAELDGRLPKGGIRAAGPAGAPPPDRNATSTPWKAVCAALHGTIRRDGDHVVWSDWRRPAPPFSSPLSRELPEYRFEAAAYDAEITRAESDHLWTWPACRRRVGPGARPPFG